MALTAISNDLLAAHSRRPCPRLRRLRLLPPVRHGLLLPPALPLPPRPALPRLTQTRRLPPCPTASHLRARCPGRLPRHRLLLLLPPLPVKRALGRPGLPRWPRPPRSRHRERVFTELAVCDPLHRRCLLLPPIPDDLAASVAHPFPVEFDRWCELFLVPSGEEEEDAPQCTTKPVAFIFASCTGQWRLFICQGWSDLPGGTGESMSVIFSRQYACRCFYWVMDKSGKMLVLNIRRMEFSVADLPPGCHRPPVAVVDAGEGRPGMFAVHECLQMAHLTSIIPSGETRVRVPTSGRWRRQFHWVLGTGIREVLGPTKVRPASNLTAGHARLGMFLTGSQDIAA